MERGLMSKITESQKRKVLAVINERAEELIDEYKKNYLQNFEDGVIGLGTKQVFALLEEFSVLKIRIFSMKK